MILFVALLCWSSCNGVHAAPVNQDRENLKEIAALMRDTIKITVGGKVFTATLEANDAATAFKGMLPLTIHMTELNGNEKFFDLPDNLPASASKQLTINSGDLMLWGSNTLVLFYKTFSTSYSYTSLGKIEDPNDLSDVLGSGNVMVIFELQH